MNRSLFPPIVSVIAMLLVVACAAGLDGLINYLRERNSFGQLPFPFLLLGSFSIGNLLIAGVLLTLITWVLVWAPHNTWVAVIYLLVGLYISSFPVLYFTPVGRYLFQLYPLPGSYLFFTGGVIAVTGLAILIDPVRRITRFRSE